MTHAMSRRGLLNQAFSFINQGSTNTVFGIRNAMSTGDHTAKAAASAAASAANFHSTTAAAASASSASQDTKAGPVQMSVTAKLTKAFDPLYLDVINESYMHNVPKGSETHFKVIVVSKQFDGIKLLERHRNVNSVLESELQTGVHALSIKAKTPAQWSKNKVIDPSPKCHGGGGGAGPSGK